MNRSAGFTLVELTMTMIIIGIISAVAMPRFFGTDVFRARGFADQVQATLRYAQKVAIAQHRNVCVTVAASDITLHIASTSGAASGCVANLDSPAGQSSDCPSETYKICTLSSTIAISPSPVSFGFDALGKPFDAVGNSSVTRKTITVSGAPSSIYVEAETGYVH